MLVRPLCWRSFNQLAVDVRQRDRNSLSSGPVSQRLTNISSPSLRSWGPRRDGRIFHFQFVLSWAGLGWWPEWGVGILSRLSGPGSNCRDSTLVVSLSLHWLLLFLLVTNRLDLTDPAGAERRETLHINRTPHRDIAWLAYLEWYPGPTLTINITDCQLMKCLGTARVTQNSYR